MPQARADMARPVTRVVATAAALALIGELRARHGPLMFHQSGGCCDGSARCASLPATSWSRCRCLPRRDRRRAVLHDARAVRVLAAYALVIDVVAGAGGMFSLESGSGKRFLTRSELFSDEEAALLAAHPPL
ncbi:hypothetical protein AWV80_32730 [Cupriavidus sp. UYMU48A]|nr:hypothetical protein AWV80_32730 [Cupriavidus sp. UYMU48A]